MQAQSMALTDAMTRASDFFKQQLRAPTPSPT
jgi:hypothetical protein